MSTLSSVFLVLVIDEYFSHYFLVTLSPLSLCFFYLFLRTFAAQQQAQGGAADDDDVPDLVPNVNFEATAENTAEQK